MPKNHFRSYFSILYYLNCLLETFNLSFPFNYYHYICIIFIFNFWSWWDVPFLCQWIRRLVVLGVFWWQKAIFGSQFLLAFLRQRSCCSFVVYSSVCLLNPHIIRLCIHCLDTFSCYQILHLVVPDVFWWRKAFFRCCYHGKYGR